MTRKRVLSVVGARPNFMKIAPVLEAFQAHRDSPEIVLVHTGQHYDTSMKQVFFEQLGIPEPDVDLEVGSGTHAEQTAEVMRRFEPVLDAEKPDLILVVGDVNSTLASALVAAKKCVPVAHVEAGLRSGDRRMPEEINRVLTDQLSELLFTTEASAHDNLRREGIAENKIHFVGNVMIDTLMKHLPRAAEPRDTVARHGLDPELTGNGYGVVTLHRPQNVDDLRSLKPLLNMLSELGEQIPFFFPLHPRTRRRLKDAGCPPENVWLLPPLNYLDMLGLVAHARLVLTDSGGLQEETTALRVPCLTLRESTERPVTETIGSNLVVGTDPQRVREEASKILAGTGKLGRLPDLWDGRAGERIAAVVIDWLAATKPAIKTA